MNRGHELSEESTRGHRAAWSPQERREVERRREGGEMEEGGSYGQLFDGLKYVDKGGSAFRRVEFRYMHVKDNVRGWRGDTLMSWLGQSSSERHVSSG